MVMPITRKKKSVNKHNSNKIQKKYTRKMRMRMGGSLTNSLNTTIHKETDAGGGGNCFYFSLYEALTEQRLVKHITQLYGIIPKHYSNNSFMGKKHNFNKYFRKLIADQITPELLEKYEIVRIVSDAVNANVNNNSYIDKSKLDEIAQITQLQPWLIHDYIKAAGSLPLFSKHVKKSIRQTNNEVQELEVKIAQQLLSYAEIELKIISKFYKRKRNTNSFPFSGTQLNTAEKKMIVDFENKPFYKLPNNPHLNKKLPFTLSFKNESGQPIVYLVSSPMEGHYFYFSNK